MKYAQPQETELGETVLIPLNGEEMNDEMICAKYTVVKALRGSDGEVVAFPRDHALILDKDE